MIRNNLNQNEEEFYSENSLKIKFTFNKLFKTDDISLKTMLC
jgi:hypothetical protein